MSNEAPRHTSYTLIPGIWFIPLVCIAIGGCWEDGCQGALDAQSTAVHEAYVAGGWDE